MLKIAILLALLLVLELIRRFLPQIMVKAAGKGALNGIGKAAISKQPDWINLTRATQPQWKNAAAMEALVRPLKAAGFTDAGAYTVDKMPGVMVAILIKPEESVIAHVYEHPKASTWLELVTNYQDGSSATLTTLPPTGLSRPPWVSSIRASQGASDALYRRFVQERKRDTMEPVDSDNVVRTFEENYAKVMMWRKNTKISPEEMKAVVEKWADTRAAG